MAQITTPTLTLEFNRLAATKLDANLIILALLMEEILIPLTEAQIHAELPFKSLLT
jgi:hypothetical protein